MKKTKIVCTIGPASENKEVFAQLVKNGLNVARLNFSHGDHAEHLARINMIKEVREELGEPVAILLDTKGPEIRTGKFGVEAVELKEGQIFTLTTADYLGDQDKCMVSYTELPNDVVVGDKILIDDGLIELEVIEEPTKTDIKCRVNNAGVVKNNKGVNVPGVKINLPAITAKDTADIEFGIANGIDFIAASFIRKADDVLAIREILERNDAFGIHIISKIENQEGVDNLDEIIRVSDGLMVARGDLGVEIPTEQVPLAQKTMIRKCNEAGKPVITATQMLDSMIRNPRPTRAESTDVANAIFDGTDAIMLSGETAAGKYPVESVVTMATIAKAAENALNYRELLRARGSKKACDVTYAVSHATVATAQDLEASAIITATATGFTARKISEFRPQAPIIAACVNEETRRKLALVWGIKSINIGEHGTTDEIFESALDASKQLGYVTEGDLVVITAGVPVGIAGATNLMKVHLVGEILIKGLGIGKKVVSAEVCVAKTAFEAANLVDGQILVTNATDKDMMEAVNRAGALIVEEGGYTSHAAIVGLSLGIPVIVGAQNATQIFKNGQLITLDSDKGIVYSGRTRVL
ncbi:MULTISPECIES: pyruvate kinase [unclassified Fusibacter]|uniref:pyruvate kinase n=1 Tax=unclassified Fusibacter TaxID=2624464 RepID=UPI0010104636|nr:MULTISPECIES: pyruvate kinase [unclassified Fusibacter]MCK8061047.1 pyruvate kinase [Fusibacter sp. A2]NPE20499.1 pyruvate kinase [Fusibacter sp. A1]RXV63699.1 pyruvate kinase [Fusibacter sp. A1]